MRVTRLNKRSDDSKRLTKMAEVRRRPIRRLVKENSQYEYTSFMENLNKVGNFSYLDTNRNKNAINLFKTQVNKLISNYGCNLQYFRKYNTFFKEGKENKANLIYGEDTTAEFYASGMIKSFVSVENMAWNFNQIGMENTEQINIIISIENFEQIFAKQISEIETEFFAIPVSGNTINNELTGSIESEHFDATIYATFKDDLFVNSSTIKMINKKINQSFYASDSYNSDLYGISGTLSGQLEFDDCLPNIVSGIISGDLTYHNFENIEGSETWKLAPQVGDYFKFTTETGINEEWEITQVFDRILTNKSGINPLLGKYIYQCSAVKRQSSYEQDSMDLKHQELGIDIDTIFENQDKKNGYPEQYQTKDGKNKHNTKTNKIGQGAFDYSDNSDETYGGYQNEPNSK